jgi:hypothetical protein
VSTRLALVLVGLVILAGTITGFVLAMSGDDDPSGLPEIDGTTVPTAYRILYEVVTPEGQSTEEHVVHRPFGARVTTRNGSGDVTSERWSDRGKLITRSQGADAVSITTAVAPSASDLRPELYTERLIEDGRLVDGEDSEVGGRRCHRVGEASTVATDSGEEPDPSTNPGPGSIPVTIERCIDAVGLVLEERWTTAGGQRVITKRAAELDVGDDVRAIELPDADPLPDDQGNGAIDEVDADQRPPFTEAFELPAPDGFEFVGRYAVVPPQLRSTTSGLPADVDTALYTDVWRRGPDLLLLDQGASTSGRLPFDDRTELGPIELAGLGAATLAADLRSAEVRLTRPDGGFVRLSGTVPIDELLELADTLTALEVAAP